MSEDDSTADTSRGWRLINTKDFGLLWWGQTTSQIGEGLNKVALLWFVYELTGSAMKMTMVGLLQTIPPLLFGPLIGVYLDRMPKKAVMMWVDMLRALLTLLIPTLYALDSLSITGLYGLIFSHRSCPPCLVLRSCLLCRCWFDRPNSCRRMRLFRGRIISGCCWGRRSAGL